MNQTKLIPIIGLLALCLAGCATLFPKADPALVAAISTRNTATATCTTYCKWEHQNRLALWQKSHSFKQVADEIRLGLPLAVETANIAIDAYKLAKTPENKAGMQTGLAPLKALETKANAKNAEVK